MIKRTNDKNNRKGFSLVELIVVLVILAILAALLIPALLGYIDRAREKQHVLEAKNCMTAAQAVFSELYATRGNKIEGQVAVLPLTMQDTSIIKGKKDARDNISNADVYLFRNNNNTKKYYADFTQRILQTAGYDNYDDYPYYLVIGTANYEKYFESDPHKPYTICFAMFQKDKNAKPIFYDGKKWTPEYPKNAYDNTGNQKDKDYNYYVINGEKIRVQYYVLCNKDSSEDGWWKNLPINATTR